MAWLVLKDGRAYNLDQFWSLQFSESGVTARVPGLSGEVSFPMDQDAQEQLQQNLISGKSLHQR